MYLKMLYYTNIIKLKYKKYYLFFIKMSRLFLAVFDVKIDILNLDICTTNTLTADKKAFIDDNTCVYYFENICVLQILENQLYTFAELEDLKIKYLV